MLKIFGVVGHEDEIVGMGNGGNLAIDECSSFTGSLLACSLCGVPLRGLCVIGKDREYRQDGICEVSLQGVASF